MKLKSFLITTVLAIGILYSVSLNITKAEENNLQPLPPDVSPNHGLGNQGSNAPQTPTSGSSSSSTPTTPGSTPSSSSTPTSGSSSTVLPAITSFKLSSTSITKGQSSTLSWSTTDAESVSINHGIGQRSLSGSGIINPPVTTTYILTATNSSGSATATATITVSDESSSSGSSAPLPVATITASSGSIAPGDSFTLSWVETGATTVTIDQGIGVVPPSGFKVITPTSTTTYTITATNKNGSVSTHITVAVIPGLINKGAPVTSTTKSNSQSSGSTMGMSESDLSYFIDTSSPTDISGTTPNSNTKASPLNHWYIWVEIFVIIIIIFLTIGIIIFAVLNR